MNWVDENNIYLVFDAKKSRSFKSVPQTQEYNPDLGFESTNMMTNYDWDPPAEF